MYKSYEIKDINDKIKYANYSIEKLKLIDNDIDFLHDTQILKYKQHRQLKEIILEILIFNIIKILVIIEKFNNSQISRELNN